MSRKAIFLGIQKIHSNKKNTDYRMVLLFTPFFKDANGFIRGGIEEVFTELDSTLGEGIVTGSIVVPEFVYDHFSKRDSLVKLDVICGSPYDMQKDFDI